MEPENILEMIQIVKKFPGVTAVDHVDFSLKKGNILGLIGENGAGKSTLMQILSGVYPHTAYTGEIRIYGEKLQISGPQDAIRNGIEMIYQELDINLDLSVTENILLGAWVKKPSGLIDWKKCTEIAKYNLEKLGLVVNPTMKMRELSTSQQQMVAIARALSRTPKILIMDEPTDVLSEHEAQYLYKLIKTINQEQNCSIIIISHKLDEILHNTRQIVVMRDGKIVLDAETGKVTPDFVISRMLGKDSSTFYLRTKKEYNFTENILEINDFIVTHPYNKQLNILESINIAIKKGEILGLAGIVGSGRTELLRAIFTGEGKKQGIVKVNGKKLSSINPRTMIECGIGYLTEDRQTDGFIGIMSIAKNITLANLKKIQQYGFILKTKEAAVGVSYIDKLKIKATNGSMPVDTLSGGNKQKVVLSKWLFSDSEILFFDEPTRGIDIGAKEEIYKIIDLMKKSGKTMIIISTELSELISLCDRVLIIGKGKLQGELSGENLNRENIIKMSNMLK
jgi:D-xylose transport system ATP-binding protein